MRIGMVVQAKINVRPLRKGNTYRVTKFDDLNFSISYFDGTIERREVSYLLSQFHYLFDIIADDLCPTCLKNLKIPGREECSPCENV